MSLLSVLIIVICLLLILIVLVQNPKGGGLSSSFGGGGGGNQLFGGVKKTTDFLDKGTWILAMALVALILVANVSFNPNIGGDAEQVESAVGREIDNGASIPIPIAAPPVAAPEDLPETVEE